MNTHTLNDKLLSICIPTCNQPDKVRRLLDSVVRQITQNIELVVRDDSTNDETTAIIDQFSQKVPIRYFHGEKEGLDKAIIFLTEEATGTYVWWLGDDVLAEGAVDHIVRTIKKYPDISFIFVNSRDINNVNDRAIKLRVDTFFEDRNQVLKIDIGLLAFISATIFKREKALSGIEGAKKHVGSALVCFYFILHVLSQDGRFYFLHTPYILSNPKPLGESRWYDSFQVFGVNLFNITKEFSIKFENTSMREAFAIHFGRIWRAVIVERALGYTTGFANNTPKLKVMTKLYWTYPEFLIALPCMLIPRPLLKYFYRVYKKFKQKND